MKYRKLIKVVSGMLCVTVLSSLIAGCDKQEKQQNVAEPMELMEVEEADTFSFDFIGGTDVMPLAGYFGPQVYSYSASGQSLPDYFSDEFMELVTGCGVNVITANGAEYVAYATKTQELLDLGEKHGVGIFVNDSTINQNLGEETLDIQRLDEQLSHYIQHPACIGAYVVDEPTTDYYMNETPGRTLEEYSPLVKNLVELNVIPYMNLFPLASVGTANLYEQYLREYLETCPVPYLSYDRYLFNEGNNLTFANDHFVNMSMVRKLTEEYGVPFWCFVQAGAQWNDAMQRFDSTGYWPTEGAFKWQANTSLAFGAKGLQYFPLLQPYWFAWAQTEEFDFQRNGLISAWSTKNQWWYYAQKVNKQIAAVDEVLMNSVNKGIIASSPAVRADFENVAYLLEGNSWRELRDVTGDAMVGCFNYFGKSAFYVVNYNIEYTQEIVLDFSNAYNMKVIQKAEESYVGTDSLKLTMEPGEGVLVVME